MLASGLIEIIHSWVFHVVSQFVRKEFGWLTLSPPILESYEMAAGDDYTFFLDLSDRLD